MALDRLERTTVVPAFPRGGKRVQPCLPPGGALYTSGMADETRRQTLLALNGLAGGLSPSDCWDDRRAEDLLGSLSTAEELRELGMDERMIAHIFSESHER